MCFDSHSQRSMARPGWIQNVIYTGSTLVDSLYYHRKASSLRIHLDGAKHE